VAYTPASWESYVDLLKEASGLENKLWQPEGEHLRSALYRQFAMNLSQGYFLYFQSSPEHPEWAPFENSVFLAQPNPDSIYYYAPVSGAGVYRVTGQRGNSPVVGFATGKNLIGMADPPGPGYNNYDIDDLEIDADGSFEIIFSAEKPSGHTGNWLYLHPESQFIILRQFSYDWGREIDVRVAIERLDLTSIKPSMPPEEIDRRLRDLFGGYVRRLSELCLNVVDNDRRNHPLNEMYLHTYEDLGTSDQWPQAYFQCAYEIERDEALIIETDLPEKHIYWNIQVIDALWNQVDLVYRQSSLNGHQAILDSDRKFRAVLSIDDPRVPNWLDTGGNLKGMLTGRWYRCSSHPLPTIRRVKLSDLRQFLPADTPTVSPSQRDEKIRLRSIGAQLRRHW
jgi:hypothetical protein